MEEDTNTYFGTCKCCLENYFVKSLWEEYEWNGRKEVYGAMFSECFAITWQPPSEIGEGYDVICDNCIARLRDAYDFKNQVLESEKYIEQHLNGETYEVKPLEIEVQPLDIDIKDEVEDIVFENVEFLEQDQESDVTETPKEIQNSEPQKPEQKRKWPKKKKKHEITKFYRQYTEEDLRNCIKDVLSQKRNRQEACRIYNVPRKTLDSKIRSNYIETIDSVNDTNDINKQYKLKKQYNFIQEIKTLLTYTNATPYKSKTARYYCAYCGTDGEFFEEPNDLRVHTRTLHVGERTRAVDQMMRPHFNNEVIKVDIENLMCTICCTALTTWNNMFSHMKDVHHVEFDEAYTRVIPYMLTGNTPLVQCVLCKEGFPNYHHLDAHMNAHYENYICSECGEFFLSLTRLKRHLTVHDTGKYPCEYCGKDFTLEKYRKKHIGLVHKHEEKVKCLYCKEKFIGTHQRHVHMLAKHKEKVTYITCHKCGKVFDWRPYYLNHLQKKHASD